MGETQHIVPLLQSRSLMTPPGNLVWQRRAVPSWVVTLRLRAWRRSAPKRQAPPNWALSMSAEKTESCRQALSKLTLRALPVKRVPRPSILPRLAPSYVPEIVSPA
jgi:hypothetical protein